MFRIQSKCIRATYYRHKIPGVSVSRMTGTATSNLADVTINDPEFFCENSVTECNAESSISSDEIMTGIEIVSEFRPGQSQFPCVYVCVHVCICVH